MAEAIEVFDFGNRSGVSKYPWDLWLDGRIWKLTPNKDFHGDVSAMRAYAYRIAGRRGIKVRTSTKDGFMYLQAFNG